ncbi:MAG: hypothetical protein Edafosvirus1_109 [Edafosvirus sp.]|uniref:Uncharacterized protein n=1 Tax=Edafosvirus sp. TaxID=2487765 RepID=A0A3G4ZSB3_9VIRU|nr:MAG: hypothetical protein Edafosvirus1_109 [Edafosvirus sp.]
MENLTEKTKIPILAFGKFRIKLWHYNVIENKQYDKFLSIHIFPNELVQLIISYLKINSGFIIYPDPPPLKVYRGQYGLNGLEDTIDLKYFHIVKKKVGQNSKLFWKRIQKEIPLEPKFTGSINIIKYNEIKDGFLVAQVDDDSYKFLFCFFKNEIHFLFHNWYGGADLSHWTWNPKTNVIKCISEIQMSNVKRLLYLVEHNNNLYRVVYPFTDEPEFSTVFQLWDQKRNIWIEKTNFGDYGCQLFKAKKDLLMYSNKKLYIYESKNGKYDWTNLTNYMLPDKFVSAEGYNEDMKEIMFTFYDTPDEKILMGWRIPYIPVCDRAHGNQTEDNKQNLYTASIIPGKLIKMPEFEENQFACSTLYF